MDLRFAVLSLSAALSAAAGAATVATGAGTLEITSFSPGSLRVTRGERVSPELVFAEGRRAGVAVVRGRDETRATSGALTAVVSHKTGLVSFEDAAGRVILRERSAGAKCVAFDSPQGERLFGLGQFQDGALDVRNLPRRLVQANTQISVPFLVSMRGWGLYWHTYSKIDFNPCRNAIALAKKGAGGETTVETTTGSGGAKETRRGVLYEGVFDAPEDGEYAFMLDNGGAMARRQFVAIDGATAVDCDNFWLPPAVGWRTVLSKGRHAVRVLADKRDSPSLFFRKDLCETRFETDSPRDGTDYVVYAGAPEDAIARWRADTGGTAALPDWAWGYWHCQERFKTQDELLAAVRWFKSRNLPLSVIVQDWQWWRSGTWNSMEWDAERFPDPVGMVDECHKLGVRVMLSVWSKTEGDTPFRRAIQGVGGFVEGTPWIDFSNKAAAGEYWKWFAQRLVSTGIDAWWLDAVEPENDALHGRKIALGDGDVYRNIYPLLVAAEADRRLRELRPGETPLVLARSAFAGQARTASVAWSGDVGCKWADLRRQIIAGLGYAAAGMPYWTSDCGGFFRPRNQYTDKEYRKVYARWMQFATFCPVQRVHGYQSDTTPSRYGPETEKILCDQIRLRERLKPYIRATVAAVAAENAMFMRPLWNAPRGFETQFMFGEDMLVCPVASDATEIDVWLPEGEWKDFHTGRALSGGRVVRADAPIDRIPVFVRK